MTLDTADTLLFCALACAVLAQWLTYRAARLLDDANERDATAHPGAGDEAPSLAEVEP